MEVLKKFGFFPDLPDAQATDEIRVLVQDQADPLEPKMIAYLESGHEYLASAGIAIDQLDPGYPIIGVPNVRTDGNWCWSEDVVYYLRKYHIRLPKEFVANMERNHWGVPPVTDFRALVFD